MLIPIDTAVINNDEDEDQELENLIAETRILSNRLNQLRYKMRSTAREKLEYEAISKQVIKLTKQINEIQRKSNKKK